MAWLFKLDFDVSKLDSWFCLLMISAGVFVMPMEFNWELYKLLGHNEVVGMAWLQQVCVSKYCASQKAHERKLCGHTHQCCSIRKGCRVFHFFWLEGKVWYDKPSMFCYQGCGWSYQCFSYKVDMFPFGESFWLKCHALKKENARGIAWGIRIRF